jgi:hypothetical protein
VSDADMKVEVNTNPLNANDRASEKRVFDMPLFELPKMAMPGVFRGIAEHSVVRVKESNAARPNREISSSSQSFLSSMNFVSGD